VSARGPKVKNIADQTGFLVNLPNLTVSIG
jgi:hypothetical protein